MVNAILSPRWQKVRRDLWTSRGRLLLMIVAVAASLFALGTASSALAVASRELGRSYLRTRPASATLETQAVDDALIARVRTLPGVAEAEGRATIRARVRLGAEWKPLILFVVPDFTRARIATFSHLAGAWTPPRGTMLVDHLALSFAGARIGAEVVVQTPHGRPQTVGVSGAVWDSSMAPASMEQTVWGYITPETLAALGETGGLDEVKIIVADRPLDPASIERTAKAVARWLGQRGHQVSEIQIPPPGRHPHQGQMTAVMLMLIVFSALALLLSAVLVANTVTSMMARQVREIGVMKAVGATTGQIARLYGAMMLVLGAGALLLAVPASIVATRALVGVSAYNLNIEVQSLSIPWWAFALTCAAGLTATFVATAVPVLRASRTTVQRAIHHSDVRPDAFGTRRLDLWLTRVRGRSPLVVLGIRNAFRRRGRLILTMSLLGAGGAMFITGLSLPLAWARRLDEVNTSRKYDVTIRFQRPQQQAQVLATVLRIPGVTSAEAWVAAPASVGSGADIPVLRTYPDKGHGVLQIMGVPPETKLLALPLVGGRWLQRDHGEDVVLNHMAAAAFPGATVGGTVTVAFAGTVHTFRVVGLVRDLGSPATVYVPRETLARLAGRPGIADSVAFTTAAGSDNGHAEVIGQAERALEEAGMGIDLSVPVQMLRTAVGDHMAVLLGLILALAALMTIVGVLGLTSTMSIGIIERTRELGVMQAVGATPALILRVILAEGLFVGVSSGLLAIALAVPLDAALGGMLGSLAFRAPLPLVLSHLAVLSWLAVVVVFAAAATAVPAWRAARMTVREALTYT